MRLMKDRIIKFIESEHITAAEFADRIGVQRSSVSHVLSGRNNPGFSFIQKILESFPSINPRWLIIGEGEIYNSNMKNTVIESSSKNLFSDIKKNSEPKEINTVFSKEKPEIKEDHLIKHETVENVIKTGSTRRIVKVLIFYDDHTFEDFQPA
ncbi:MAG: helix-turn-helix transcriptional regulator [Prolixibacteraceae bacterium]|nr:helix-turn-helix transcriptional regulator [Prolixibacteraceae bacterium]